ncbi:extensin family protein [Chachezhania antarctica]|uniref:extensin-like domain-containing protein n=1 Tax=Chachezhania antarctica TaxID=2340860 RepID=UPI000EB30C32|nr:extensin family protein [Chachezhania antarctica]|tara:strand:+ start:1202 stop:2020 length:819 start_codon:yes stop_codon:yes gene_type:complete
MTGLVRIAVVLVCAILTVVPVLAEAPGQSLRPQARPQAPEPIEEAQADPAGNVVRPRERNYSNRAGEPAASAGAVPPPDETSNKGFLGGIFSKKNNKVAGNAICGIPDLTGKVIGRVPGRIRGCGIDEAVLVESAAGVLLSPPAMVNCPTAKAIRDWVENGVKPAFGRRDTVVSLRVAAHYSCRTRNNRPGAKISEHGKGNAIDISAFNFDDGDSVTVLKGWGRGRRGRALKSAWKAACGPFGTVLGPRADRYHRDHFHMDTARYRSGTYCR